MNAITILDSTNAPMGPFTRAEVAQKLQRNEVTLSSLAFVEGLAQWTPLGDVLARVDAATPPPVPFAAPPAPAVTAPYAISPAYSYAATMEPPAHFVYAGFWLRVVAYIIDRFAIGIPLVLFDVCVLVAFGFVGRGARVIDSDGQLNGTFLLMEIALSFVGLFVYWLYFALMESSAWQATLGKKALGLRVTDMAGQRIGFGRASGRFFGKIISGLTVCIGYIMAGFTPRKQALHDMIAGTLVVRG